MSLALLREWYGKGVAKLNRRELLGYPLSRWVEEAGPITRTRWRSGTSRLMHGRDRRLVLLTILQFDSQTTR